METEDGGYATTDEELDSDRDDGAELDLKMWLQQLDAPTTPVAKISSSKNKTSSGVTNGVSVASKPKEMATNEIDFDAILGELNTLDEQFTDLEQIDSPSRINAFDPPPPLSTTRPSQQQQQQQQPDQRTSTKPAQPKDAKPHSGGVDFGDIDSQLMDAIFELNKLVDGGDGATKKPTSGEKPSSGAPPPPPLRSAAKSASRQPSGLPDGSYQPQVVASSILRTSDPHQHPHPTPPVDDKKFPGKKPPAAAAAAGGRGPVTGNHQEVHARQPSNGRTQNKNEIVSKEDSISVKSSESRSSSNSQGASSEQSSQRSLASDHGTPQVCIKVFASDDSCKTVMTDEHSTVGMLCEVLMQKNLSDRTRSWAITEQIPELLMQRCLEDHQFVLEEIKNWPNQSNNRLVFAETPKKYDMFDRDQVIYEKTWEAPGMEGWLHLKSDGKKAWKKWNFILRNGGIFYNPKGKQKDLTCLKQLSDVNVYTGVAWKKKFKAPTEFGFALKPRAMMKKPEEEIKYICADDAVTLWKWVTAIRLAKYGYQLYRNFRQSLNLPEPSSERKTNDSQQQQPSERRINYDSQSHTLNHRPGLNGHQRSSGVIDDSLTTTEHQNELGLATMRRGSSDSARSSTGSSVAEPAVPSTASGSKIKAQIPITPITARLLSMQTSTTVQTLPRPTSQGHGQGQGQSRQSIELHEHVTGTPHEYPSPLSRLMNRPSTPDLPPPPPPEVLAPPTSGPPRTSVNRKHEPPPPEVLAPPTSGPPRNSVNRKHEPPPPPRRDQMTKLSFKSKSNNNSNDDNSGNNPVQTRNFILNLQRAIGQKGQFGVEGLLHLEMPLPPPPVYSEEPSYLDLGELPPPPAELLEELKVMRRRSKPPPPAVAKKSIVRGSKVH